jgi:hypothetical protein
MICHNEPSRYQEVKYSTLCAAANIFGTIFIFVLIYVLFLMHMHCEKIENRQLFVDLIILILQ